MIVTLLPIIGSSQVNSNGKEEKPMNVVFILSDDLGLSDTELYGTTKLFQTPNILCLAKHGMTFT
tara:strand:+ start:32840 stop:33034 length:195 start_codon:yes stop_codon:yes gene_type:complete